MSGKVAGAAIACFQQHAECEPQPSIREIPTLGGKKWLVECVSCKVCETFQADADDEQET
jgi:hypothetical protein